MPDQKRRKNFLYPRPKEGTDPTEQREFPYLPEAVNASFVIGGADAEAVPVKEGTPIPAPEPEPAEPPGKYPCPCCGYLTFPVPKEDALAYDSTLPPMEKHWQPSQEEFYIMSHSFVD